MRAATLFSGIGAPEVSMPEWRWIWHAEIEPFPSAVMAERHPSSVNLGDVTADDFCERALAIGRPDVLVFGSPCQSFSVSGKRLGLDDPRGNLALVALGIVDALRPSWFVFENVHGLFSSWSGGAHDLGALYGELRERGSATREFVESSDFAAFLSTVRDIRYCGAWTKLDAQFAGLAQRRDRLFFVGYFGTEWQRAAAVLLEPEGLCGHPPPRGHAGSGVAVGALTGTSPGGGWRLGADEAAAGQLVPIVETFGGNNTSGPIDAAAALNAKGGSGRMDFESETLIAHSLRGDGFDASEDGPGRGTPLVAVAIQEDNQNGVVLRDVAGALRSDAPGTQPCGTLAFVPVAFNHQASPSQSMRVSDDTTDALRTIGSPAIAFQSSQSGVREVEAHATLDANNGSRRHNGVMVSSGVRRLMPVECERLQGFPDHYTAITYRGKPAADGPRYKAIGNSMAVPVVRWILDRIEVMERLLPFSWDVA